MWDESKTKDGSKVWYEVYYKEVQEFSKGVDDFQGNTVRFYSKIIYKKPV